MLSFILTQVKTGQALYDFTDEEGVRQRVWEVRRPESVEAIREMFARVPCAYIADGHHRTASAMRVAHEMRAAAQEAGTYTGKEPFNYFLSVLFPASELTILPYNRVVSDRAGLSVDELIARIHEAGFTVEPSSEPVESTEVGVMGLFTAGSWYRLSFTPELASAVAQAGPVESLDVSVSAGPRARPHPRHRRPRARTPASPLSAASAAPPSLSAAQAQTASRSPCVPRRSTSSSP